MSERERRSEGFGQGGSGPLGNQEGKEGTEGGGQQGGGRAAPGAGGATRPPGISANAAAQSANAHAAAAAYAQAMHAGKPAAAQVQPNLAGKNGLKGPGLASRLEAIRQDATSAASSPVHSPSAEKKAQHEPP